MALMEFLWLWIALAVVVVLAVLIVVVLVSGRNTVRRRQERVDAAWGAVTAHIASRGALLGELRDAVGRYADHEGEKLAALDTARAELEQATSPLDASAAEDRVQGGLRALLQVAEGYPDLQRDAEFLRLQGEIAREGTEIQTMRRQFNGAVREYNTSVRTLPGSLVAGRMGAEQRAFFEVTDRAAISAPPKVQF